MSQKLKNKGKSDIHLIAHTDPKLSVSEQYRSIRTNIQYSSVDKQIKSIMITSPEASDGKSTSAANLAIVLAQQGGSVLLVDTDLRRPTVHYSFNISNLLGLTSVLTKKMSLDQVISRTSIPNLSILTSGPIPPNPSELLDSKAMVNMMKEMHDMFEYVVFDTPPVLAVTDPQIIANKCDGVVIVVSSGKTHKDAALKAKNLLIKVQAKLLGVVVHRVLQSNIINRFK